MPSTRAIVFESFQVFRIEHEPERHQIMAQSGQVGEVAAGGGGGKTAGCAWKEPVVGRAARGPSAPGAVRGKMSQGVDGGRVRGQRTEVRRLTSVLCPPAGITPRRSGTPSSGCTSA